MTRLARKLSAFDYFTLGFGAMVGAGWLVVMDDWLSRGGPLGAMLGFAIGGLLLTPVAYAYSRMVVLLPDAGSEIAYTTRAFSRHFGFASGWMMLLAYLIVCPWEAVAIGRIAGYFIPALNTIPLYQVAGHPVYLPHLVLGLALTVVIAWINFRGIALSAGVLRWVTILFLSLFSVLVVIGGARGSMSNLRPGFNGGVLVSILLMLQIIPYYLTGFESAPKCSEESNVDFKARDYPRAIFTALFVGVLFYVLVIAVVAHVAPWQELTHTGFATSVAFERATRSRVLVDLIFATAAMSLVKIFNANFVAASRIAFALGRARLIPHSFGRIHHRNQTPWVAVLLVAIVTTVVVPLGSTLLVSISEVGSLASAVGWLSCSLAFGRMFRGRDRLIAALGALVAASFASLKFLPWVPGHFSRPEWIAFAIWVATGAALYALGSSARQANTPAAGEPLASSNLVERR